MSTTHRPDQPVATPGPTTGTATAKTPAWPSIRQLGWVLLVTGLVGGTAAFILAVEKFWLLTNPFYTPSCSVNARFSCGTVMTSEQAELFGFPNPLLGIAGFAADLGLDVARWTTDYNSPATLARVEVDRADGTALGLTGTPSFFVNGDKLEPESVDDLTTALDDALAR